MSGELIPDTELGIVMTLFCPTPTSKHQFEPSGRRFKNPSGSTPMILEYWGAIANLISMAKSALKFSSMPLMVKEDDLLTKDRCSPNESIPAVILLAKMLKPLANMVAIFNW